MSDIMIGVDIGGSGTKACVVANNQILATASMPTEFTTSDGLGILAVSAVSKALAETGIGLGDITSIGLGVPGQVRVGHVRNAANLGIGEEGFDLGGFVSSATRIPCLVENDMRVSAYGAYTRCVEVDPSVENLVYVGLGTGVSAGVILNGEVFRGSRGLAGEFGHVPMGTGLTCACGSIGCLETVIGAAGLSQAWDGNHASSLFRSAVRGDTRAQRLADRTIEYLADAMWWLAATYDPDVFFIGGGVGANTPGLREMLTNRWREMSATSALARIVLDPDRIRMYDLEEPVGAYGAALLAAAHPGLIGETT